MAKSGKKRGHSKAARREGISSGGLALTSELIEGLLSAAVEHAGHSVMITNRQARILYVNPAFEAQTGYSSEEVVGENPKLLSSGQHDVEFYARMWDELDNGRPFHTVFRNHRRDGSILFWEQTISPILNKDGETTHFVSTGRDITRERLLEDKLSYLADHDHLTGLANRRVFERRLKNLHDGNAGSRPFAMIVVELDGFGAINQRLGRSPGDRTLIIISERLRRAIRDDDLVVRLGGDEFAVLAHNVDTEAVRRIADRILEAVREPISVEGEQIELTASIGIAVHPDHTKGDEVLPELADQAMRRAKTVRNTYRFHDREADGAIHERAFLKAALRTALRNDEYTVAYQPVVDTASRTVPKVEALVRWNHPTRGNISPAEFIPVAEESGLISEVDCWVLQRAVSELASLMRTGVHLSINCAPRTLRDPELAPLLLSTSQSAGIALGTVCLELTERTLVDGPRAFAILEYLSELGVKLSLDDFGTGYSSLSYLKNFPFDEIKIDRSFVANLEEQEIRGPILLRGMINLISDLGLECVVEGVEAESQFKWLVEEGGTRFQGFWFARPMPCDDLSEWVRRYHSLSASGCHGAVS